jgi:hypothetical protein
MIDLTDRHLDCVASARRSLHLDSQCLAGFHAFEVVGLPNPSDAVSQGDEVGSRDVLCVTLDSSPLFHRESVALRWR